MIQHARPGAGRGVKDGAARQGEMKFRVLRLGGSRKAFRLETPFWEALEVIAREKGGTLEDEVRAKLDSLPDDANHASALQVGAIEDMIAFWRLAESRASRLQWAHVLEASPSPAFALMESGRILYANSALVKAVRGHRLAPGDGPTEIAVELPAQAVGEALRSGGQVHATALFRSGPFRFSARARLAGHVDGAEANPVVIGFLEAG
ncbi:MAG: ribbon-helix-helix domain-containing protein [Caulobacteraceae bacterium]